MIRLNIPDINDENVVKKHSLIENKNTNKIVKFNENKIPTE